MISGYPRAQSVRPGAQLFVHVSTDAPRYRVDFYRQGADLDFVDRSPAYAGSNVPEQSRNVDWGWPSNGFTVPMNWSSGVYVGKLIELKASGPQPAPAIKISPFGPERILFAVLAKPGTEARILFKLPLYTYHAYDAAGGSGYVPTFSNLHRRGGGVSGDSHGTWDQPSGDGFDIDDFDPRSRTETLRQRYSHWEAPFLSWLAKNGYRFDACTDFDLDSDDRLLDPYCLFASSGHDEYWTDRMRANLSRFLDGGGNAAFFSGNTCFRRMERTGTSLFVSGHFWPDHEAENKLIGVAYRNAGGWWQRAALRPALGYRVQHADHWIFDKTQLADGDVFGAAEHLVGYECDGAYFPRTNSGVAVPDGSDQTPASFVILGLAELQQGWVLESREPRVNPTPPTATMGMYTRADGGIVFNAATTDWSRVLAAGEARVVQITKNVLDHLQLRPLKVRGPADRGCHRPLAIAGREATFHVDASPLINAGVTDLRYKWSLSFVPISPAVLDQPVLVVELPAQPQLITVRVVARSKSRPELGGCGSMTVSSLDESWVLMNDLVCRLRELAIKAMRHRSLLTGLGEGDGLAGKLFVDPLWDPVPHWLMTMPRVNDLRAVMRAAEDIARISRTLIALQQPKKRARSKATKAKRAKKATRRDQ